MYYLDHYPANSPDLPKVLLSNVYKSSYLLPTKDEKKLWIENE